MSASPGTFQPIPHRGRRLVTPILAAVIGSSATAAATSVVPATLVGPALAGLVAIVAVRMAPMASLLGLTWLRAALEGFGPAVLLRIGGVGLSSPDVLSLAFLVGALWWLAVQAMDGNRFWQDWLAFPAVFFAFVAVASLAYSPSPVLGARDLLKWGSAVCAYMVIIAARPSLRQLKFVLAGIVGGAVFPLLLGWWQLANGIGKPNLLHGGLRIQSTFNHPSTYGFYALTVMVAAWGLRQHSSGAARTFLSVVGLNAFAACLFTLSRTAWGALAIVLLVLGWRDRRVATTSFVAGGAILAAVPRLISRVVDVFQPREGGKGNSVLGRLDIWSREIKSFGQEPLIGHGFGYTLSSQDKASHNDYLRMLVETGVVGFFSLVALIAVLIRYSWITARERADLPLGFFGLSLGYAFQGLSSNNLGKGAYQFYFWVLAGASVAWASVSPSRRGGN